MFYSCLFNVHEILLDIIELFRNCLRQRHDRCFHIMLVDCDYIMTPLYISRCILRYQTSSLCFLSEPCMCALIITFPSEQKRLADHRNQ